MRRSPVILRDSCVASQFLRRVSSGCEESVMGVEEVVEVEGEGPTPARRVSWRPGAEGAEVEVVAWVVVWDEEGAIRIAWKIDSV